MRAPLIAAALILVSCATTSPAAEANEMTLSTGGYSLEVTNESGSALPTYEHNGRTYILGSIGQRYFIHVWNRSSSRIEVVASVDGRDVIDGHPSNWGKRGYIVNPYDSVAIDGYRLNQETVAAFRFSSVPRSYASQMGSARDVGVIGVAIFPERPRITYYRPPRPYYAEERGDFRDEASSNMGGARAPSAKKSAPSSEMRSKDDSRPGLGTEFGESHDSHVDFTTFVRASSSPAVVLGSHYNDREGLLALGVDVDGNGYSWSHRDSWLRETADPFRHNDGFSSPPAGWRP